MAEAELPKKRDRKEENYRELLDYNEYLLAYTHKLEFSILETTSKLGKYKSLARKYITQVAHSLDKAGLGVSSLPNKLFEGSQVAEFGKELSQIQRVLDERESKKKKSRPKKNPDVETNS